MSRRNRATPRGPSPAQPKQLTAADIAEYRSRAEFNDYPLQKWVQFSDFLLGRGFTVTLKESLSTVSKYLTVTKPGDQRRYVVRFSNHPPRLDREQNKDCDFFVGKTNLGWTNTVMAQAAVLEFFNSVPTI